MRSCCRARRCVEEEDDIAAPAATQSADGAEAGEEARRWSLRERGGGGSARGTRRGTSIRGRKKSERRRKKREKRRRKKFKFPALWYPIRSFECTHSYIFAPKHNNSLKKSTQILIHNPCSNSKRKKKARHSPTDVHHLSLSPSTTVLSNHSTTSTQQAAYNQCKRAPNRRSLELSAEPGP